MTIVFAADHGGYELKNKLIAFATKNGYTCIDTSPIYDEHDDYPVIAQHAVETFHNKESNQVLGIAICTTGQGICMALNKYPKIRAGLAYNVANAAIIREHNGAHFACIPGTTQLSIAQEIFSTFVETKLNLEERHKRRRNQLDNLF